MASYLAYGFGAMYRPDRPNLGTGARQFGHRVAIAAFLLAGSVGNPRVGDDLAGYIIRGGGPNFPDTVGELLRRRYIDVLRPTGNSACAAVTTVARRRPTPELIRTGMAVLFTPKRARLVAAVRMGPDKPTAAPEIPAARPTECRRAIIRAI